MRIRAIVACLAAALVVYRAVASFHYRHFSPNWEFARGHAFVHGYDAVFTYAPLAMLGIVAWGAYRRQPASTALGFVWLLVLLVGPPWIAQRTDRTAPVFGSYFSDPTWVFAVTLCLASLCLFTTEALRGRRAAA